MITGPNQDWLPFEDNEDFQAARAEAEATAEAVIQAYTVEREVQKKKPRNESLPSHLRREEQIIEGDATQKACSTHGERTIIGYDTTETLIHQRPELYVLVKYPKYACSGNPECGITSPERPTSLVEGGSLRRQRRRPRSSRPSGSTICRSTASRISSRGAVGRLAVRRC